MNVKFIIDISGVEHWGLSQDQKKGIDSEYWLSLELDIKNQLSDIFGIQNIKVSKDLEGLQ